MKKKLKPVLELDSIRWCDTLICHNIVSTLDIKWMKYK